MGYHGGIGGHIILKSDGEPALVCLRDALSKYHGGTVVPELSAKNESQSNGTAKEAGKTVREFTRVLKEQIEDKTDAKLSAGDAITLWLVRWAAMVISRYLVGKDGRTAYERRRGRPCRLEALPCGEKVWYKEVWGGKDRKDKFNSEWEEGIWLGHTRSTNEMVMGTKDGVVRAYAIKRQDDEERWKSGLVKEMRGTPQQPNPNKPGLNIPIRVTFDEPSAQEPIPTVPLYREKVARRMKITKEILENYGYTEAATDAKMREQY